MTISKAEEAEMLRLYHAEKWKVGTIGTHLGRHHTTVVRVLTQAGVGHSVLCVRPSLSDPYIPFIREKLTQYPKLCSSRLHQMIKERGYTGGPDHFRVIVARHRPRPVHEAYLRLRTLPGEQAQVDWGHFGKLEVGNAMRCLYAFVMVLSYSRQVFLRFYLSAAMACFLRGHVEAFEFFGGIPRVLLYDNLKSAVLERRGDAIHFNPTLLELSGHYRYEPRPVAVARGNEKGRVEKAIRYIRDSFFAARKFRDVDDLNHQATEWMTEVSAERRCPEERNRTVAEVFDDERGKLLPLPDDPFDTHERVQAAVGKTPYVRFDLNDYSVPSEHARSSVTVLASLETVRITDGKDVIATHKRTWDRGQQIEDPRHIAELWERKAKAREHRGYDRLWHAAPSSRQFFEILAERGNNLGSATSRLLTLLDATTAEELESAISEAIAKNAVHVGAVRQILDRRYQERGKPPPLALRVGGGKYQHLVVRPHSLSSYDDLNPSSEDPSSEDPSPEDPSPEEPSDDHT
ncbi:MAG: IS21 family transposase [Sulfuricaulis sp.]|nr:IS21 family transposase [Sulfuricaulis sp.]